MLSFSTRITCAEQERLGCSDADSRKASREACLDCNTKLCEILSDGGFTIYSPYKRAFTTSKGFETYQAVPRNTPKVLAQSCELAVLTSSGKVPVYLAKQGLGQLETQQKPEDARSKVQRLAGPQKTHATGKRNSRTFQFPPSSSEEAASREPCHQLSATPSTASSPLL